MPKRNIYHSRGDFFLAKQEEDEIPEEHWKKLNTGIELRSQGDKTRRPIDIKANNQPN